MVRWGLSRWVLWTCLIIITAEILAALVFLFVRFDVPYFHTGHLVTLGRIAAFVLWGSIVTLIIGFQYVDSE